MPGCVIYSLGSNNEWDVEEAMLAETPCEVFTFDCTSEPPAKPMGPRLHFEKTCLGDGSAGDARFRSLAEIAARSVKEKGFKTCVRMCRVRAPLRSRSRRRGTGTGARPCACACAP